ncbi:tripartite tricarboxylate transporter substrate binding protein [Salicibibacter cibarius]|uniref:Tripartite tricarboxylate transporter substrate binding protein n=1 Tax=Salicibibacter cibarius TaxID=2743000 RepID=A0A7T7CC37_9BACI|nr:tripartite tricarboxylate transporter substrate binding protein [Salicibibacter cibarius]QQK76533.1 tripartite tricarboxylate transporter substrate binding protein [Salicibibacter cibarius]
MIKKIGLLSFAPFFAIFATACGDQEVDVENYPEEPVTFYVNYSSGGNTDVVYRQFADVAEEYLGEEIIIENVDGGGGTVGVSELANEEPDGYTMGNLSMAPLTVSPHNQQVPYSTDDFSYVGGWGLQMYGLVAPADAPYDDLDDFVEYARENPGMSFSDPAPGGLNGLAVDLLDREENGELQIESVPYDGGGESTSAVLGGHVDFTSNNPSAVVSGLDSGDLKLIASMSDVRFEDEPDVPTAEEQGYDVNVTSWFGIGGPEGLPEEIIETWEEVIQQTLDDPEFQESAESLDTPLEWMPGDEYEELIDENYELYGEIISDEN